MPNDQVWGNPNANQIANQDLVSLGNEIIEVADIEDNSRVAMKASNKDGANSVAIEAEGQVKVTAVSDGNPASVGILAVNESTNADAFSALISGKTGKTLQVENTENDIDKLALDVKGDVQITSDPADNKEHWALKVTNQSTHSVARAAKIVGSGDYAVEISHLLNEIDKQALHVNGNTKLRSRSDDNKAHVTLNVENPSTHADALAIKAQGTVDFDGIRMAAGGWINTSGLSLNLGTSEPTDGVNLGRRGKRTAIRGDDVEIFGDNVKIRSNVILNDETNFGDTLRINNVYDGESHQIALFTKNIDNEASARAFKAEGMAEIVGNSIDNPASTGLKVKNDSNNADARALKVEGIAEIEAHNYPGVETSTGLIVKNEDLTPDSRALKVEGKAEISDYLYLGTENDDGTVDANSGDRDLLLGTLINKTNNVQIGSSWKEVNVKGRLDAENHIRVGDANNDGEIDAADDARDLKIGTQADYTGDVILSRSGKDTTVKGDLEVEEDLRVGPVAATGKIDANGDPNAQNLKIGSNNTTANVELGRANQTVDMQCQARMNSNSIVMDNLADLVDGSGQVYNPAGHGFGASIDWVIEGVTRFCVDSTGGHNV